MMVYEIELMVGITIATGALFGLAQLIPIGNILWAIRRYLSAILNISFGHGAPQGPGFW
jgi:hypothetical protein